MSKNFDDILKSGKQAAVTISPKQSWKNCVANLMHEIHKLNQMYGDDLSHHIMIEQRKCELCNEATFIIVVREFDNPKRVLKFHKANWKSIDTDRYNCEKCKKG